MPNRIIREGLLESEAVNSLSSNAEVFFFHLMLKADDFGRYTANPILLKCNLFPLKVDSIREADISRWTAECEKAGLIALYEAEGKKFLFIKKFHQRTRIGKSKFPAPPAQCPSDDSQMSDKCPSSAHGVVFGDGDGVDHSEASVGTLQKGNLRPPSLEEVKAYCSIAGIDPKIAGIWWDEHNARPYSRRGLFTDRDGNEVVRWQSALKAYAEKWRANQNERRMNETNRANRGQSNVQHRNDAISGDREEGTRDALRVIAKQNEESRKKSTGQ